MTFTLDSSSINSADNRAYIVQYGESIASAISVFKGLSIDDQLALLWFVYTEMGLSITPAATGAARLQLAEGLLNQIKQMNQSEQLAAMRDLASQRDTPISRSYGIFSPNTKLAFWYELSELMVKGFVVPIPANYQLSRDGFQVLAALKELDFGEQITVLRKIVSDMGVDALAE
jgi:hypothetical protein